MTETRARRSSETEDNCRLFTTSSPTFSAPPVELPSPVEEFHSHIERENSQRKMLLAQAVLDRERRTAAEVHRLERIKAELAKLDHILSSDVAILRKEIEIATMEFNEAELVRRHSGL